MNPYKKYLSLDYEKLSETEMMQTLNEVLAIANTASGNSENFYSAITPIIMAGLKLKYKSVCDRFRKIYPLSFPDIEYHYPNPVPEPDMSVTTLPMPTYPMTAKEKKAVDDLNKLAQSFRKRNEDKGRD